jgi:AcrR family transcriptional regulator
VRDKHGLLHAITAGHVQRLAALVPDLEAASKNAEERLLRLVARFMHAYADAGPEHRVLTEDTRFLAEAERETVVAGQRELVRAFAERIAEIRPDLADSAAGPADTAVAMLLLGMMNWTFTWLRPDGPLSHDAVAALVTDFLSGGLPALRVPRPGSTATR